VASADPGERSCIISTMPVDARINLTAKRECPATAWWHSFFSEVDLRHAVDKKVMGFAATFFFVYMATREGG